MAESKSAVLASIEYLSHRADAIRRSHDLTALAERLARLARPLLDTVPYVPPEKAQLSQDGGLCPEDGSPLEFDPWSPQVHRCPRCGGAYSGERHFERWLMWYHLWLAERAVHLALLGALRGDAAAASRAADILAEYGDRYPHYPNRDCVLGPSRLFFSTYLECIWLCGILGAADLLRAQGRLPPDVAALVTRTAKSSAGLIAEFNEGLSNRQTWHHVALLATGAYLGDRGLAGRALVGLAQHLTYGVDDDGMWYEGENYHFFAQRAFLLGAAMGANVGVDLFHAAPVGGRLAATFDAPLETIQPDLTFPARRDAQFGASLRQPRFAEAWELAVTHLREPRHVSFLRHLYCAPGAQRGTGGCGEDALAEAPDHGASEVAEVEYHRPAGRFGRDRLSWKALLWALPELPDAPGDEWRAGSRLLEAQGLAVLRRGRDRSYLSLEFGDPGGGHGHPDRLHLSWQSRGRAWLVDFGTASYVRPDLFWYRSTLAHNAPVVDGVSQAPAAGACTGFAELGDWAWCRGMVPRDALAAGVALTRTVFRAPDYLLDVLEVDAEGDRSLLLPWHFLVPPDDADWEPVPTSEPFGASPFVTLVRRCPGHGLWARGEGGAWHLAVAGTPQPALYSAAAPGRPYTGDLRFIGVAARGSRIHLATAVALGASRLRLSGRDGGWEVEREDGATHRFRPSAGGGWVVEYQGSAIALGGVRPAPRPGPDLRTSAAPPRTLVVRSEPPVMPSFSLETAEDYRRAEEPYPGPDRFAAAGRLWWTPAALHLELTVRKPTLVFRAPEAPNPRLDNEAPDIHSDGLQVYLRWPGAPPHGYVVVPDPSGARVRVRPVAGTVGEGEGEGEGAIGANGNGGEETSGRWEKTPEGYRVALRCAAPQGLAPGMEVGFDCLVNEMWPERRRRAGQLVLSGGGGWVWLAGDRQSPERWVRLELA